MNGLVFLLALSPLLRLAGAYYFLDLHLFYDSDDLLIMWKSDAIRVVHATCSSTFLHCHVQPQHKMNRSSMIHHPPIRGSSSTPLEQERDSRRVETHELRFLHLYASEPISLMNASIISSEDNRGNSESWIPRFNTKNGVDGGCIKSLIEARGSAYLAPNAIEIVISRRLENLREGGEIRNLTAEKERRQHDYEGSGEKPGMRLKVIVGSMGRQHQFHTLSHPINTRCTPDIISHYHLNENIIKPDRVARKRPTTTTPSATTTTLEAPDPPFPPLTVHARDLRSFASQYEVAWINEEEDDDDAKEQKTTISSASRARDRRQQQNAERTREDKLKLYGNEEEEAASGLYYHHHSRYAEFYAHADDNDDDDYLDDEEDDEIRIPKAFLELRKKDPDMGKKDDGQKTWGQRTINPHKSCNLYYILPPKTRPNCPYPFVPPPIIPVSTILNLMIKSIVGLTIPPIVHMSHSVWNIAGMLPIQISDSVMLETSATLLNSTTNSDSSSSSRTAPLPPPIIRRSTNKTTTSNISNTVRHSAVNTSKLQIKQQTKTGRGETSRSNSSNSSNSSRDVHRLFRHIFSPTGDLQRANKHNLLPEMLVETGLQLNITSQKIQTQLQQQQQPQQNLHSDVVTPKKASWTHAGKMSFKSATMAISGLKSGIASAIIKHILPSKGGRLATLVIREVHDRVSYPTILRVKDAVVHGLLHTLPQLLSYTVGDAVAEIAEVEAVERLTERVITGLTNTVTRSLTHSVSLTLATALSGSRRDKTACYMCQKYSMQCEACNNGAPASITQQVNYYATYYSNYFSTYFLDPTASVYERKKK
eukprot:jgi/Bigna1/76996/fgenesh1_pg.45_\